MVRKYRRNLGSRKYKDYSEENLQRAIEEVKSQKLSLRKAAEKYNVHYNTIYNKLHEKHTGNVGRQTIFSVAEEEAFLAYLITMSTFGFPMTTIDLRVTVSNYLQKTGRRVPTFKHNKPGKEWAISFLRRNSKVLSERKAKNITHDRAATNEDVLNTFFDNLATELIGIEPGNIWNYDETNLRDDPGEKKVITKRGSKYPERIRNSSKACTTIMFAGNANGEIAPLYVCYKAEHLWDEWTEGGPPAARYNRSKSGWFDSIVFEDWFYSLMFPILKRRVGRKILIGDNLSSHINMRILETCKKENIAFIALPPNSTHILQPLDVAFFRPVKYMWREILETWKQSPEGRKASNVPKTEFPALLSTLVEGLEENSATNLKSGFRKAGIWPPNRFEAITRLPNNVLVDNQLVKDYVSDVFMDAINEARTIVTKPAKKRCRNLRVEAGRSISHEDVQKIRAEQEAKKNSQILKKRGRPCNNLQPSTSNADMQTPKKRGRPRTNLQNDPCSSNEAQRIPKKRGRPPKKTLRTVPPDSSSSDESTEFDSDTE